MGGLSSIGVLSAGLPAPAATSDHLIIKSLTRGGKERQGKRVPFRRATQRYGIVVGGGGAADVPI